jgi:hypothetical protein
LPTQRHRDHQSRDDLLRIVRSSRPLPQPRATWLRKVQNRKNLHAMRTLYQAAVDRADSAIRRETPPPARHGL